MVDFDVDAAAATAVMREAGSWLFETGKSSSPDWAPDYLTVENLLRFTRPDGFHVGRVGGVGAVAAILQTDQLLQDWSMIDREGASRFLYIRWLSVARAFAGQHLAQSMIEYAGSIARYKQCNGLRLSTDADQLVLTELYETLGFELVAVIEDVHQNTALFQRAC